MSSGKFIFENVFSPENKQRTLEELSNIESESILENFIGSAMKKKAAILVPLCYDVEHRPALLFNLRSKSLRSHQGELCFPGGSVDPEDDDNVVTAALRETEEEIGIPPADIDIWTTLPYVPTVTSIMRVSPVLGFIKKSFDPKELKVNPAEVEFAFTVPIEHLCDPKNWESTNWSKKGRFAKFTSMPAFANLDEFMGGQKVRLWGLTAIVTHMVLTFLVPEAYQREIAMSPRIVEKPKL
ncbi:unnamed protein product [Allacma fusca]|uniref:Nudix hydrolase domain-containing protein n=1 Tax=Allacma fusca TaxID=39272 RepID=A0A8J2JMZ3_9HEXA|nr:unnamed protein product [Allacma fusca]